MLSSLYKQTFGHLPLEITPLTKAGSNRQYFRIKGEKTVIGAIGTSVEENEAFIYLSQHFKSKGLPVPEVFAVSNDRLSYLQEDLGDVSLFAVRDDISLLKKAVAILPDIQYRGAEGLDFDKCYPVREFNAQSILWDLNYFKYCFLNTCRTTYNESLLEVDFQHMAVNLSVCGRPSFMYRDFQSRNVMVKDGNPFFIDFQGGRKGPAEYDLVSFITQARAKFSIETKQCLIDTYIASASRLIEIDRSDFLRRLKEYELLRCLQVLGAYGFRGKFERKPHFLHSIPQALSNLARITSEMDDKYPYLKKVLTEMLSAESNENTLNDNKKISTLTVHVSSFSYKKGIPQDPSGNGGGFVFDCRGMENPGRYGEFKPLTGLDKPVIDFLENKGEIMTFLDNCYGLVDPSVECYDRRGFTSLSVNFGCTGGQHRSVYSAQHMAEHLKEKFPHVNIHLMHREQNIEQTL